LRALQISVLVASSALLAAPAASAHRLHTVAPGETLWWIAAQNDLTTRTVAVFNGLAPDARVVLGSTLKVPTVAEGAAALAGAGVAPAAKPAAAPATTTASATTTSASAPTTPARAAATSSAATAAPATAAPSAGRVVAPPAGDAPQPMGAYVVREGDTLSALAAQTGVSVDQMSYMNGLDPQAILAIGTVLKLPTGAPAPARASQPAPVTRVIPIAWPTPTPARLSADRVMQLAAEQGAPGALAAAIAWQESGFNNALVSSANARGVMQVMPGTWDWVQRNLARVPLNPSSAEDNVRAGALYLARLLRETGGDMSLAAAAYYQGLYSVRSRGMFEDTKRYVSDVMALSAQYAR
jgi:soluble lytic murein transglycosylase-like protein